MKISRQGAKTDKDHCFFLCFASLPARLSRAMDGQAGVTIFEMASTVACLPPSDYSYFYTFYVHGLKSVATRGGLRSAISLL